MNEYTFIILQVAENQNIVCVFWASKKLYTKPFKNLI